MECNELNLRSVRVVNTQTSSVIVEHTDDEVSEPEQRTIGDQPAQIPIKKKPPSQYIVTRQCHTGPPYLESVIKPSHKEIEKKYKHLRI